MAQHLLLFILKLQEKNTEIDIQQESKKSLKTGKVM
jgi:hypothetical protein